MRRSADAKGLDVICKLAWDVVLARVRANIRNVHVCILPRSFMYEI